MTKLNKPVKRTAEGVLRGKNLVVTLYPHNVIGLRQLRCKKEYTLPLITIYNQAIRAEIESKKAAKKAARKEGRKS